MPPRNPTRKFRCGCHCGDEGPSGAEEKGTILNKELTAPMSLAARPAAWLRTGGVVLAGSAFVAVCAHVVLPLNFTPVPLTLQTFAVLLLSLVLGPRLAAGTMAAYLAEGALGLPVFSPVPVIYGGVAHLLGPTGGYLLAYPLAAAVISTVWRRTRGGLGDAVGSGAVGSLLILGCGALWLAVLTHGSVASILALGVTPFLPGEGLKIAAAAGLAAGYQRFRRRGPRSSI